MEIHLNSKKKKAYKFLTTSFSKRSLRNNLDKNKKVIERRKDGKMNKRKRQLKKGFEMYVLIAKKNSSQFTHKKYVKNRVTF